VRSDPASRARRAARDSLGGKRVRYDIRIAGFWDDDDHSDRAAFSLKVPDGGTGHREIYGGIFPMEAAEIRRMIGAAFRETHQKPFLPIEKYVERFTPITSLYGLATALRCMLFRVKLTGTTGKRL
jgi:hypothetical protein